MLIITEAAITNTKKARIDMVLINDLLVISIAISTHIAVIAIQAARDTAE